MVVVQRHHLYAVLTQCLDHGFHLLGGYDEVAVGCRLALFSGLEIDHRGHTHRSVEARTIFGGDLLGATDIVLMDAALRFARMSEDLVELLGVEAEVLRPTTRLRQRG